MTHEVTKTFEIDGQHFNVPTAGFDEDNKAIEQFFKTNPKAKGFATNEEAVKAAQESSDSFDVHDGVMDDDIQESNITEEGESFGVGEGGGLGGGDIKALSDEDLAKQIEQNSRGIEVDELREYFAESSKELGPTPKPKPQLNPRLEELSEEVKPEIISALKKEGFDVTVQDDRTVAGKIADRFFGTDVEDPIILTRAGTTALGAISFGFAGSRVPPVPGLGPLLPAFTTTVASAVGTAFGAMAPEATIEIAESLGLVPEGTRMEKMLSPSELKTVIEGEVLLDLATSGGILALRQSGRVFGGVVAGVKGKGKLIAEEAAKLNIHLMPVQVGDGVVAKAFVNILGRFPLLGGRIAAMAKTSDQALKKVVEGLPTRIGPLRSFSDISLDIFNDGKALFKEFSKRMGNKYESLFAKAEKLGVGVIPVTGLSKTAELLEIVAKQRPATATGPGSAGDAIEAFAKFVEDNILVLETGTEQASKTGILDQFGAEIVKGNAPLVTRPIRQTLKQMDGLIEKIDQQVASLEPGQKKFAIKLYQELRQALQLDIVENMVGKNADQISSEMRLLDEEFTHTMSQVFETSIAKRFGRVERRGIAGVTANKATTQPIDKLAKMVIELESPQAIDELAKLVTPKTFDEVVARTFQDAIDKAMGSRDASGFFDPDLFAKTLGLDKPDSSRYKAVKKMLEHSTSNMTMDELDVITKIAQTMATFEIPNISTFIARRATIGGLKSAVGTLFPMMAAAGGAGGALAYGGFPVLSMLMVLGGSRAFAKVISDPKISRQLKNVLKLKPSNFSKEFGGFVPFGKAPQSEAGLFARRKAMINIVSGGLKKMLEDGDIEESEWGTLNEIFGSVMGMLDREYNDLFDNSKVLKEFGSKTKALEETLEIGNDGKLVQKDLKKEISELNLPGGEDEDRPDEADISNVFGGDITLE